MGQLSQAEIGAHLASYMPYSVEAAQAGIIELAHPGAQDAAPFSVSLRDGKAVSTDGTVEPMQHMFGGYYVFNVKDRAEAEAWAAKIPAVRDNMGSIQLFPLGEAPSA
jgi:hypothetical protein